MKKPAIFPCPARLSPRLEKTLDQLERVTTAIPSDDELIGYLVESGALDAPVRGPSGRKGV